MRIQAASNQPRAEAHPGQGLPGARASDGSVFGHPATLYVLLLYVFLIANAFLVGIQLDANVRERA